jgi:aminoglycoside phosphotransferase (APT) family kinase protein
MEENLKARLESRLRELGHSSGEITEIQQLTGGASRQMWLVRTNLSGEWSRFVLRMDHPSDPDPEANTQEARVLTAAHNAGVASPGVLDHSAEPKILGTPYLILSFIEGETIAPRILKDERYATARQRLPAQLGEAIGRIHGVPLDGLGLEEVDDPIDSLLDDYAATAVDRPALLLGLRELARRKPEAAPQRTLVHGDFRLGNLMVDESGLAAVLDWELTHLGDPFEDLGYVCMRAWRFGGPGRVAGVGEVSEFLDAYESQTGFRPTEEQLTWWEARATAWWGIGCIRQMQRSVPGHTNELELLAIGRRTAEQEHDLLELLYPDVQPAEITSGSTDSAPQNGRSGPSLFTEPAANELFNGLESYLTQDLIQGEGEPNRFKARVAKNVVSLLRREEDQGPSANQWYARALHELGVEDEKGVAQRVQQLPDTSASSEETRRIVAVLKTAARLRLEVSNPKYLT